MDEQMYHVLGANNMIVAVGKCPRAIVKVCDFGGVILSVTQAHFGSKILLPLSVVPYYNPIRSHNYLYLYYFSYVSIIYYITCMIMIGIA